jgi:hypothetical protein
MMLYYYLAYKLIAYWVLFNPRGEKAYAYLIPPVYHTLHVHSMIDDS